MNDKKNLIFSTSIMLVVFAICASFLVYLANEKDGTVDNSVSDNSDITTEDVLDNNSSTIFEESSSVSTEDNSDIVNDSEESHEVEKNFVLEIPADVILKTPNILVYDIENAETIFELSAQDICYPASLTKMLTALVALDYLDGDDVIKVGEEINLIGENSSTAYLVIGQRYKLQSMLDALLIPSGNDAAYSLAVTAARIAADDPNLGIEDAISDFVRLMNLKAKSIGCTSSNFCTPDGYDAEGQYTTAKDLLKISIAAYNNQYIRASVAKANSNGWYNSNMLVREDSDFYCPSANGLKTGSTDLAGYCLSASAVINDKPYIMLFLNGSASSDRFRDAVSIIKLVEAQTGKEESEDT